MNTEVRIYGKEKDSRRRSRSQSAGINTSRTEDSYKRSGKKILPNDFRRMRTAILQLEERGLPREQAELEAFSAIQREER